MGNRYCRPYSDCDRWKTGIARFPGAEYGLDSDGFFFELTEHYQNERPSRCGYMPVELAGVNCMD